MTPCYISDEDTMQVLCDVQVINEGDTLPHMFDNYIYCQAERGEHTTDGFRKLRLIHSPEQYSPRQYIAQHRARLIHKSVDHGYMSSSKFLATTVEHISGVKKTKGPCQIIVLDGSNHNLVRCFYVKTWPKEAERWFTRETHWPDKQLKSKIKKIGYLLVPTGNSNSQVNDLEWRCSFSLAEKILFQSMTKFQRCTFVILKVLLKEYLPADINTDGEKQLLSTYHIKTLILWCLEDSKLKWEPEHMLDIIGYMLYELSGWINRQYIPHYFIPSVNLYMFDGRWLHGRESSLIHYISIIRNDLSNKIKQSQVFVGQELIFASEVDTRYNTRIFLFCIFINDYIMKSMTGRLQMIIHNTVYEQRHFLKQLSLIESIISIKPDIDPHMQYLYRVMYNDPIHDKLLTEVLPGLIDQYRGCIHLAKYCMSARDGRVLPGVLHTAESLLKDTLHVDPCSGYVKLACLYIATENYVQAMGSLHIAENKFLFLHKNMVISALRNVHLHGKEADTLSAELCTGVIHEVFQKWAEGQVTSDIVVTWPEYNIVPGLLQFELIHESTHKRKDKAGKMVSFDCRFQLPPLNMIKLLKFICAINSARSSTLHMGESVADLIASALSITLPPDENDIYIIFNLAACCYIKINKYKEATRMMTVAIGTSSQTEIMKRCAFSHHFLAYIIEQFLAKGSRVLVYKRDNVWP